MERGQCSSGDDVGKLAGGRGKKRARLKRLKHLSKKPQRGVTIRKGALYPQAQGVRLETSVYGGGGGIRD